MYNLIDCHCHLDFDVFDHDRSAVIERARQAGIRHIVIPGVSVTRWHKIAALCATHVELFACFGIHPYTVNDHSVDQLSQLQTWLQSHQHVAVGECGLDFREGQAEPGVQQAFFQAQLDIAHACSKPVVIHAVRATQQVIESVATRPGLRGMVHSFSGSYQQACQLIDLGFYISLGGAITYDRASRLRETAKKIPLNALLLETDAPDQPDSHHKNKRNEPAFLTNVLTSLAQLRHESAELIAEQTCNNAKQLFDI